MILGWIAVAAGGFSPTDSGFDHRRAEAGRGECPIDADQR
jgi:hypothetical protein